MTATLAETVITEPGVYDLDEAAYHRDPVPGGSLSCSGAKKLLPPSCPALFDHDRQHGSGHKDVFDFGHAAHTAVLGIGAPVCVIDADSWRTKAAQEQRDAAYARGETPLLPADAAHVAGMAEALRRHPIAAALFDPTSGKAEQSLFRQDPETGVWLRSRLDWMPTPNPGGLVIVGDYKTCASADPGSIARAVANFGYDMQAAWYGDMVIALGLANEVQFGFAFQMKSPPYLVTVVELTADDIDAGRRRNRDAIDLYASCVAAGRWPGYADDEVVRIALPAWARA